MRSRSTTGAALAAVLIICAALALFPVGDAWAKEAAEGQKINLFGEAFRFINFFALLAILYYALRKPLKKVFAERKEKVEKALEEARLAKEKAEEQLKENERKLALLQEELERIRQETELEARSIKEKAAAEAEQLALKILDQAKTAIELEKRSALDALHVEASLLAIQLAEKILDENVKPEDQKRLIKDYLTKLGEGN